MNSLFTDIYDNDRKGGVPGDGIAITEITQQTKTDLDEGSWSSSNGIAHEQ